VKAIRFNPDELTGADRAWWDRWSEQARKATQQQIDARMQGQPVEFNSSIWSELKEFLLGKVFHGKCAYCESKITAASFGDAEHYRPKGKVTVREQGKESVVAWNDQPHPGYYWLAYDWRNLLPACQRCNSADGKMNQFPVQGAHCGPPPADPPALDEVEKPRLLHPYYHDPAKHLRFGEKGVVSGLTDEGETSIRVYDLGRDELRAERQAAQESALLKVLFAAGNDQAPAALAEFQLGASPYSAAALDYVRIKLRALNAAVGNAPLPTGP
jgi:hypothetical protein